MAVLRPFSIAFCTTVIYNSIGIKKWHAIYKIDRNGFIDDYTMKIDLYNNHETFKQESKQNSAINSWYRDIGLTAKDIDTHPCITDLAILIRIRNAYWTTMTASERALWAGSWGVVYKDRKFLRPKTLNKFETLVVTAYDREQRLNTQRTKIQSLRHTNTEPLKRDQDNEANGSHSHSLHKQTVTNERAIECPYF